LIELSITPSPIALSSATEKDNWPDISLSAS